MKTRRRALVALNAHPDGDRFVIVSRVGGGNEVVLWLDWLDEAKALLEERVRPLGSSRRSICPCA